MSFELLDKLGIKYRRSHVYKTDENGKRGLVDLPFIHSLQLPFTANEWLRLCMRDGDAYIGSCCGQAGQMQDILNHIFRDSGWVEPDTFRELIEACIAHDGADHWMIGKLLESTQEMLDGAALDKVDVENPWDKLVLLWNLSKDLLSVTSSERPHVPHTPVSGAWRQFLFFGSGLLWAVTEDDKRHASNTLNKAKVWASLRVIYDSIEKDLGEEVVCFGIRNQKGELAEGFRGSALHLTREAGEKFLNEIRKYAEEDDNYERKFRYADWTVGKCRVTVASGLEWLD
jgi:hypothetical protein